MKLNWTARALQQLSSIRAFIAEDSPETAVCVVATIVSVVGQLETYPFIGREGRVTGTRELVVPRLPYIVPYRI